MPVQPVATGQFVITHVPFDSARCQGYDCDKCTNAQEVTRRDRWYEYTQKVGAPNCGSIKCTTIYGEPSCICPPQQGKL